VRKVPRPPFDFPRKTKGKSLGEGENFFRLTADRKPMVTGHKGHFWTLMAQLGGVLKNQKIELENMNSCTTLDFTLSTAHPIFLGLIEHVYGKKT
jgi:hypothetical protein